MGILPREFWRMTPGEVSLRAYFNSLQKEEEERSAWQRDAHFTAQIMNASGHLKRKVKGADLYRIRKSDGGGSAAKRKVTGEERRRQALETFRYQKTKFWGKISDASLAKLTAEIEGTGMDAKT